MPTPTPISLKTQLEQAFAAQIYKFAGVTGSALDPDLASGQRIKEATGSYLLLPGDMKKGPLVRLKLMQMVKTVDLNGNGEGGRSGLYSGKLRIVGISQAGSNLPDLIADRDLLEEVIKLNLLKSLGEVNAEAQNFTGGKSAYVAEISHLGTDWNEDLAEGGASGSKQFVAIFTQEWDLTIEETAGE